LIVTIGLPAPEACKAILLDTIERIAKVYPKMAHLRSDALVAKAATRCVGLDGRQIRKAILSALAHTKQIAANPESVTGEAFLAAIERAQSERAALETK